MEANNMDLEAKIILIKMMIVAMYSVLDHNIGKNGFGIWHIGGIIFLYPYLDSRNDGEVGYLLHVTIYHVI